MKKVYFASDHAGYEYKKELIPFVGELGYETSDVGPYSFDKDDDYPEFIANAARKVSEGRGESDKPVAVILGGSGQGEAIMANRFKGVRTAVYNSKNLKLIQLAREHNDANILSLGARFISLDDAKEAVKVFLELPFSGEDRHERRIKQIEEYST